jgi:hypothetical protein
VLDPVFVTVAVNGLHAQKHEREAKERISERMRGRVGNRAPYRVYVAVLDRDVLDDPTLLSPLA